MHTIVHKQEKNTILKKVHSALLDLMIDFCPLGGLALNFEDYRTTVYLQT